MSDQSGTWQPDPFGRHQYRYWNGTEWTDQVSNDGVVSSDPATAEGAADAADAGVPTEPEPTQAGWGTPPPDATTSMPAADPAFPPPAFAATAPAADAPKKSSGNTPALVLGGVLLVALLGAGAWLLFGGDDDSTDRAALISELREGGLSAEEAECVVDEVGEDTLADLSEDGEDGDADDIAALTAARAECTGAGEETTDTTEETTDTTEETTDTTEDGTDTSLDIDDEFLDSFVQGFMSTSGLSEEDSRCFAEEFLSQDGIDLSELSGDPADAFANPQLMAGMQQALTACGIDASSFGTPTSTGGTSAGGELEGILPGQSYGDNPTLDALWDACEGGDLTACDDLYWHSEVGSDYEEFGLNDGQVP